MFIPYRPPSRNSRNGDSGRVPMCRVARSCAGERRRTWWAFVSIPCPSLRTHSTGGERPRRWSRPTSAGVRRMGSTFPKVTVRPKGKGWGDGNPAGKGRPDSLHTPSRSWAVLIYPEPPSSTFPFPFSLPSKDKIQRSLTASAPPLASPLNPQTFWEVLVDSCHSLETRFLPFFVVAKVRGCVAALDRL